MINQQISWKQKASYLWPLPALAAFFGQRILAQNPAFTETYIARGLFQIISKPIAFLTSLVPFSMTEALNVIGYPVLLALLILFIIRLVRLPDRKTRVLRLLRRVAWTASILYLVFMLLHGFNYARLPVAESFSLPVRERSVAELNETADWLVEQANSLRALCEEDEQGVMALPQTPVRTIAGLSDTVDRAAQAYPLLSGASVRPKSVLLSHYWSYTGITGLYFPFFVESNVNTDIPDYQIPHTALHEIAHTRGFAREDEANFLAFLSGLADTRPEIAYSVVIDAATRSLGVIYGKDRDAWEVSASRFSDAVWRDMASSNAYWKQFEGPVREVSTTINDTYLKANLQDDGVQSYGRMLDLLLAWYDAARQSGQLDSSIAALAGEVD